VDFLDWITAEFGFWLLDIWNSHYSCLVYLDDIYDAISMYPGKLFIPYRRLPIAKKIQTGRPGVFKETSLITVVSIWSLRNQRSRISDSPFYRFLCQICLKTIFLASSSMLRYQYTDTCYSA